MGDCLGILSRLSALLLAPHDGLPMGFVSLVLDEDVARASWRRPLLFSRSMRSSLVASSTDGGLFPSICFCVDCAIFGICYLPIAALASGFLACARRSVFTVLRVRLDSALLDESMST